MKKKGRPKNINTKAGRSHSILLSRRAELVLREEKKRRKGEVWLSQYFSRMIIKDFCTEELRIMHRLQEIQTERDEAELHDESLGMECKIMAARLQELKKHEKI